jgi:hypothetical protein
MFTATVCHLVLIHVHLGEVFGPFISLPHQQQRQVVEFLYYASNIPEKLMTAINRCRQGKCYFLKQ